MDVSDIKLRLGQMQKRQADLARYLDLDPSSLTKTLKGERRFQPHEARALEQFFGEKITGLDDIAPVALRHTRPRKIPLFGYAAAGGGDRIAYADDRVLDWLDPPPFWTAQWDLVYVRITGESMEPRIHSGEIVPVRIGFPPASNDDCLIEFNDSTALVKTYKGQRDNRVHAWQYQPAGAVDFDATSVRALHTIWRPGMSL